MNEKTKIILLFFSIPATLILFYLLFWPDSEKSYYKDVQIKKAYIEGLNWAEKNNITSDDDCTKGDDDFNYGCMDFVQADKYGK